MGHLTSVTAWGSFGTLQLCVDLICRSHPQQSYGGQSPIKEKYAWTSSCQNSWTKPERAPLKPENIDPSQSTANSSDHIFPMILNRTVKTSEDELIMQPCTLLQDRIVVDFIILSQLLPVSKENICFFFINAMANLSFEKV